MISGPLATAKCPNLHFYFNSDVVRHVTALTSVVRLRRSALRWSAGFPSFATFFWCLIANTVAPFWGPNTILLARPARTTFR